MRRAEEAVRRRGYGAVLLSRGLLVAALDEFQQCLSLAEQSGEVAQIIPALNAIAYGYSMRRELDRSLEYLKRALTLSDDQAVPELDRLKVYLNLMMVYDETGQLDAALEWAGRASKLKSATTEEMGPVFWLNLCKLYWHRQEWVQMRHASNEAYRLSVAVGDPESTAKALMNLGIAHLEMGAYLLAEKNLNRALQICQEIRSSEIAYVHAELGRLYFLREEYQHAMESGREALESLLTDVATLDKEEVARVSRLFGAIFSVSGQRNLTLKYLNRAAAYFSQLGLRAEWQRSTELIGKVLSEPARPMRSLLTEEVHKLDFLTAVLDLTDDLESVDPYLRGHSDRVAKLAVRLGEEIGLSGEELLILNHAAILHDVGMIAVDAELHQRPGELTEAEQRRVNLHSVIGEEMMRPYGLPPMGLAAIRHHHEHFDGTGTPDGLRGTDIPILARLIGIADVYDALTSDRSYRSAMTHVEAIAELLMMAGRELDPELVDRFLVLHEL